MRQLAADAVILKDGEVLLVKRGTEPFKGMWAIPGGRIEDNETLEQCCVREAKEETGLDIKVERLVGMYSIPSRDPRKVIAAAYLCTVLGGSLNPMPGEIEKAEWFPLDKVPELASDHGKMLKDALKLK
ncbi:MAG: NUDIX hydrolase [Candidatus ainarchaeum sp.]|nr:NUDIX hydrolase [Candidatus ainarchaeum sp.]